MEGSLPNPNLQCSGANPTSDNNWALPQNWVNVLGWHKIQSIEMCLNEYFEPTEQKQLLMLWQLTHLTHWYFSYNAQKGLKKNHWKQSQWLTCLLFPLFDQVSFFNIVGDYKMSLIHNRYVCSFFFPTTQILSSGLDLMMHKSISKQWRFNRPIPLQM